MGFKEKRGQFCQQQLTGLSGRRKSTNSHLARKKSLDAFGKTKPNQQKKENKETKKKRKRETFSRAQKESQTKNPCSISSATASMIHRVNKTQHYRVDFLFSVRKQKRWSGLQQHPQPPALVKLSNSCTYEQFLPQIGTAEMGHQQRSSQPRI